MEVNFYEKLKLTSRKSNTKLFYIVKQSYLDITKITVLFIFFWSIWVLIFSCLGGGSRSLQEKKKKHFFFFFEIFRQVNNSKWNVLCRAKLFFKYHHNFHSPCCCHKCNCNFTDCGVIFVSGMGCLQRPNCLTLAYYSTTCALPRHCLAIHLQFLPSIPKQTRHWAQKEALSLFCSFIEVSLSTASD